MTVENPTPTQAAKMALLVILENLSGAKIGEPLAEKPEGKGFWQRGLSFTNLNEWEDVARDIGGSAAETIAGREVRFWRPPYAAGTECGYIEKDGVILRWVQAYDIREDAILNRYDIGWCLA